MYIVRYNNIICEAFDKKRMGHYFQPFEIKFLEFFEGTDEVFISKWKRKYPNHKFQIFKHKKKALSFEIRLEIEKSAEIKSKLRDYNISKLLD